MGSGASGLALYWNLLVWVNTCAPFRATDPEGRDALGLDYTSSAVVPLTAPRKPSRLTGKAISVPFALFTRVRGETVWKIGMGCEIGVPEAAKWGRKSPDRPLFAAQDPRPRGLRLFSKQFRKANSAKFAITEF